MFPHPIFNPTQGKPSAQHDPNCPNLKEQVLYIYNCSGCSAALPGFTSHHDLQEATIGQLHCLPFHDIPLQCFSRVIHLIDSNRF